MEKRRREGPRMMRASAVAAGGFLLLVGVVILLVSVNSRTELLDGPASGLPTNAGTPRSAMPSSWLSSGDEKSSPLLQDSSDNAVQVLATPGAAVQPAHDMSLAARDPPTALQPEAPAPAAASASAATGSSNKLGAVATALSGQIASLPKPPAVSVAHHLAAAPKADARVGLHAAPKKHLQWEQAQNPDSWKNMVRKAEEAASALAKQHPRSVLGAHW